jgi:menaquinol-cytochrome c reductase iron-sulfur subunit
MQENQTDEKNAKQTGRRSFLKKFSIATILLGVVGQLGTLVRSLVPNVLYEPPMRLKIGKPDDFVDGVQFLRDERLFLFKKNNEFYCITAVCTHLGCTVKYTAMPNDQPPWHFHCPCHGSKFKGDGDNFAGPAPRPLQWYKMELAPEDGQLIVDFSREVDHNFRLIV